MNNVFKDEHKFESGKGSLSTGKGLETGLCPADKDTVRDSARLNSMVYARVTENGKEGRVPKPGPQGL